MQTVFKLISAAVTHVGDLIAAPFVRRRVPILADKLRSPRGAGTLIQPMPRRLR